jgi:hypothetical protein
VGTLRHSISRVRDPHRPRRRRSVKSIQFYASHKTDRYQLLPLRRKAP